MLLYISEQRLQVYLRHFRYYTGVLAPEFYVLPGGDGSCASVSWPILLPPILAIYCNNSYQSRDDYIRSRSENQLVSQNFLATIARLKLTLILKFYFISQSKGPTG